MSDNYKPTVEVRFRDNLYDNVWRKDDGSDPDSERALLVRGVPMVGDRVEQGKVGVVKELVIRAKVEYSSGVVLTYDVDDLRPATRDAEVEAMLSAFVDARAHKMSDRDIVEHVRDALNRVRGTE